METVKSILIIMLLALSAGAVFFLIIVLIKAARVLQGTERTVEELNETLAELRPRVMPIVENAEQTVARINNDLEQFEFILADISSVTENIAGVSDKVTTIVEAPVKVSNTIVERFLQLRKDRIARKKQQAANPQPKPGEPVSVELGELPENQVMGAQNLLNEDVVLLTEDEIVEITLNPAK